MMIGRGSDMVLYYRESDEELKPLEKSENVDLSIPKFATGGFPTNQILFTEIEARFELNGKFENSTGLGTDTEENMKIVDGIHSGVLSSFRIEKKHVDILFRLFVSNNYRKMHGLPMRRRVRK